MKTIKALAKTITKKHDSKFAKKLNKEISLIKFKLASAKNPERRAALKAQLKIAKKILALKKLYAKGWSDRTFLFDMRNKPS